MRVLIAHNRYRTAGGEERHIDLLEQGLAQEGVEVRRYEVTTPAAPSVSSRIGLAAGMAYRPSARRRIRPLLRQWRPDVVHVHNMLPLLTPSVLHEAQAQSARVVLTAHNFRLFCPAGTLLRSGTPHDDCVTGSSLMCGLRGARDSRLEGVAYGIAVSVQRRLRLIDRWVDAIVVPSQHLAATLQRAGFPRDQIHVIRYGVDVNGWHPREREYALYAGRLSQEKGIDDLLEAARLSHVPLRIAGDGPLSDTVRKAADRGEVEYLGRLAPSELSELRQRAAFVVVPSVFPEISPFAALEAFADGTPVIASTTGGLPEIVDDPQLGTTVSPQNPPALAKAMSEWWDRRNETDLGRAAWERASERYDLSRQTQSVLRLYESVLGSS